MPNMSNKPYEVIGRFVRTFEKEIRPALLAGETERVNEAMFRVFMDSAYVDSQLSNVRSGTRTTPTGKVYGGALEYLKRLYHHKGVGPIQVRDLLPYIDERVTFLGDLLSNLS